MPCSPDDPALVFVPLDVLATPREGFFDCQLNRYWMVHPERGAMLRRIGRDGPLRSQAHKNEKITRTIRDLHYPWTEVRLIPRAFVALNIKDYV